MEEKIGKHGEGEPKVCAVTGQPCAGRHSTHYSIGDGYYISILEKVAKRMNSDELAKVIKESRRLIPSRQSAVKLTKTEKEA